MSQPQRADTDGEAPMVWIAYYLDWSDFVICATEIEALRCAVERTSMVVAPCRLPVGREQIESARRAERRCPYCGLLCTLPLETGAPVPACGYCCGFELERKRAAESQLT